MCGVISGVYNQLSWIGCHRLTEMFVLTFCWESSSNNQQVVNKFDLKRLTLCVDQLIRGPQQIVLIEYFSSHDGIYNRFMFFCLFADFDETLIGVNKFLLCYIAKTNCTKNIKIKCGFLCYKRNNNSREVGVKSVYHPRRHHRPHAIPCFSIPIGYL